MHTDLTVVAISSNTNSFGLKSVTLFRGDRRAFQALANQHNMPFRGQVFAFMPTYFECVTELPRPSVEVFNLAQSAAVLANAPMPAVSPTEGRERAEAQLSEVRPTPAPSFTGSLEEELTNQDMLDAEEAL